MSSGAREEQISVTSRALKWIALGSRASAIEEQTIIRHLKMLEEAGVVTRVIHGRSHRLALRPDTLAEASEWIESQRTRWEALFDAVGEYLEERADRR